MLRIGMVAGEASGDYLAAKLIRSIRQYDSDLVVEGIGGPKMQQQGCRIIYPVDKLSVMGFAEVLGKYWELSKMRSELQNYFIQQPPDIFIGIDAPDFNLKLEKNLHAHNIKTAHYVSPQVWAWREYRIKKIKQAVDLMLVLFPFEKQFYDMHKVPAVYVGHPLAEQIPMKADKHAARKKLCLPEDKKIVALMPGSRKMEFNNLTGPFLLAADNCRKAREDIHFATSLLTDEAVAFFKSSMSEYSLEDLPVSIYKDVSHDIMEAADLVLLASGTITLEAMLIKKPMVVAYKAHWLSYCLMKAMSKVKYIALPNLLADMRLIPECIQQECNPARLELEIMKLLDKYEDLPELEVRFTGLHKQLKLNTGEIASKAILELVAN